MFIDTCDAQGVETGWYNLDRIDRVQFLEYVGDNYRKVKLTQGANSVTTHISGMTLERLLLYLRE